ncbi:hypothetical protein ACN28S_54215 [Cystobacter fuscus]
MLLDFEWTAFNPAAEPWVPGPSRALSAWQGVAGLPEPEVLGAVVEGGAPLGFELHVRRGGEERWFQARAVKQGDGFALWLSDRTEAHERERVLREALGRAHEALEQERKAREREAYLSLALETAHMVTWEWSEARGSFSLSANAEDFFGAPPEGLGNTVEWLLGRAQPEERVRIAEPSRGCAPRRGRMPSSSRARGRTARCTPTRWWGSPSTRRACRCACWAWPWTSPRACARRRRCARPRSATARRRSPPTTCSGSGCRPRATSTGARPATGCSATTPRRWGT